MKVVMFIWQFWPALEGGTERQCRRLSIALVKRGIQVAVVTSWPRFGVPRRECRDGVHIVRCGSFRPVLNAAESVRCMFLRRRPPMAEGKPVERLLPDKCSKRFRIMGPFRWLDRAAFILEAMHVLKRVQPDILHIHETHWIAGVGAWAAQRVGVPCVCKESTYPVFPAFEPDTPWPWLWEGKRRQCDAYVILTNEGASDLAQQGVAANRITMIPNGVNLPALEQRDPEDGLVLCVANLSQGVGQKGFDVLISAWSQVAKACPHARLVIAGGGDSTPWERQAEMLGCRASITFAGFVSDLERLYKRAAVFVLPSRKEGMSNALLEAQSWGIPAVVTDIPGNRAIVHSGETGLVVPPDNADNLAQGIVRLLEDATARAAMGQAARRVIETDFSLGSVVDRWEALYQRLLLEHRAGT